MADYTAFKCMDFVRIATVNGYCRLEILVEDKKKEGFLEKPSRAIAIRFPSAQDVFCTKSQIRDHGRWQKPYDESIVRLTNQQ